MIMASLRIASALALLALTEMSIAQQTSHGNHIEVSGGVWNVPSVVIEKAMLDLQSEATLMAQAGGFEAPDIGLYIIQYQGVELTNEKNIAIRGSCQVTDEFRNQLSGAWYLFSDGTPCYFGAFYNPQNSSVSAFEFFGMPLHFAK